MGVVLGRALYLAEIETRKTDSHAIHALQDHWVVTAIYCFFAGAAGPFPAGALPLDAAGFIPGLFFA